MLEESTIRKYLVGLEKALKKLSKKQETSKTIVGMEIKTIKWILEEKE